MLIQNVGPSLRLPMGCSHETGTEPNTQQPFCILPKPPSAGNNIWLWWYIHTNMSPVIPTKHDLDYPLLLTCTKPWNAAERPLHANPPPAFKHARESSWMLLQGAQPKQFHSCISGFGTSKQILPSECPGYSTVIPWTTCSEYKQFK